MIRIYYRHPDWLNWNMITARDEAEAARWRAALQAQGFQVKS